MTKVPTTQRRLLRSRSSMAIYTGEVNLLGLHLHDDMRIRDDGCMFEEECPNDKQT